MTTTMITDTRTATITIAAMTMSTVNIAITPITRTTTRAGTTMP